MSERNILDQLIIKNLNIIETAGEMLSDIEKKVFGCVNTLVKEWVEEQEGWTGKFDYLDDDLLFYPKSWNENESKDFPHYSVLYTAEDDAYYISLLCGEVLPKDKNFIGIYWTFPYKVLNKKTKKQWMTFINEQYKQYQTELSAHHIELDSNEGWLFRRIEIDAIALADNYPDTIEDVLNPVSDALKDIENAFPIIEKIYKEAALTA